MPNKIIYGLKEHSIDLYLLRLSIYDMLNPKTS